MSERRGGGADVVRHRLVVTEKPSVARDLARVLGATSARDGWFEGEGLRITWCVGHLLELEEPAAYDPRFKSWTFDVLPIVPDAFRLRVRKGVEGPWRTVRSLLRDPQVGEVVNACDAGREGELIFRQVYAQAGCTRPVLRFWTSSLTDEAVRAAWGALRPSERFDALGAAARCRSEADWLVGMNATRAMTCRTREVGGDALWSVGRVQTPTLAMIVQRDRAIEAFRPETYWTARAVFQAEAGALPVRWFRRGGEPEADAAAERGEADAEEAPHVERLTDEVTAEALVAATRGAAGRVVDVRRRTRRDPPPLLYDLTSLQRRANQRYGLSAQRTLEIAQALYERHKLITYPRTDARHLTKDQVPELPAVIDAIGRLEPYRAAAAALLAAPIRPGRRVVDDAEVGDHHAILPTARAPEPGRLDPDEKRVYDLVARRLLAALSPEARIELTDLVVEAEAKLPLPDTIPLPTTWRAKGRVVAEPGWMAIDPPGKARELDLPPVAEGQAVHATEVEAQRQQTRPPRPHDDATLLRGMETAGRTLEASELARALRNAGLGTPATRAAVLQTLVDRGYVVRDGRALRATPKGFALVETLPVEALKSAELTGRWEKRLADVAEGRESADVFHRDVVAWVHDLVAELRSVALPASAGLRRAPEGPRVGACPACGGDVHARGPVWRCAGPGCGFVVYGTIAGKKIGVRLVKALLADGRVGPLEGFTSKAGKPFVAGLELRDGAVAMWFPDARGGAPVEPKPAPAAAASTPAAKAPARPARGRTRAAKPAPKPAPLPPPPTVGQACPACGVGTVIRGRAALGCSRWREGCGWRGPLPPEAS